MCIIEALFLCYDSRGEHQQHEPHRLGVRRILFCKLQGSKHALKTRRAELLWLLHAGDSPLRFRAIDENERRFPGLHEHSTTSNLRVHNFPMHQCTYTLGPVYAVGLRELPSWTCAARLKQASSGKNLVWEKTLSSADLQTIQTSQPVD